jgi:molybdenum-dependent DNA-binding transcriptional regulator ModE
MALSLKQIRYFVATAETGQISHAAVQLMISQSAVTTAIKDLERTVGAELFERHPHGMELTSSGREFLSHAYGILDKVREATQLNLAESDLKAKLTVAAAKTTVDLAAKSLSAEQRKYELGQQTQDFWPTHYVDITDVAERKKSAAYANTLTVEGWWPLHDQMQRSRGNEKGCKFAEAFNRHPQGPNEPASLLP